MRNFGILPTGLSNRVCITLSGPGPVRFYFQDSFFLVLAVAVIFFSLSKFIFFEKIVTFFFEFQVRRGTGPEPGQNPVRFVDQLVWLKYRLMCLSTGTTLFLCMDRYAADTSLFPLSNTRLVSQSMFFRGSRGSCVCY